MPSKAWLSIKNIFTRLETCKLLLFNYHYQLNLYHVIPCNTRAQGVLRIHICKGPSVCVALYTRYNLRQVCAPRRLQFKTQQRELIQRKWRRWEQEEKRGRKCKRDSSEPRSGEPDALGSAASRVWKQQLSPPPTPKSLPISYWHLFRDIVPLAKEVPSSHHG